jgi:hypothetical protein
MAITYYVALPFIETPDGPAAGQAQECQNEYAAMRAAETLSRKPEFIGALAFKRSGDPNAGEFSPAEVIRTFGNVPDDLSEL